MKGALSTTFSAKACERGTASAPAEGFEPHGAVLRTRRRVPFDSGVTGMAIYHFERNGVSPAAGSSAVKASAYISGAVVFRELTGTKCSYRRAERVVLHDVELPEAAPAEYRDPEALWNAAEAAQRGNECYAHRENMALPRELAEKDGEFEKLVRDYVERVVKATGHAVEWGIHDDGDGNYHAHKLESDLAVGERGFERPADRRGVKCYLCRKAGAPELWVDAADWKAWARPEGYEKVFNFKDGVRRTMSEAKAAGLGKGDRKSKNPVASIVRPDGGDARRAGREELVERRKLWADCVNAALERNGFSERVSHLSNAERGLEEEPTRHLGYRAHAMERDAMRRAAEAGSEYSPVTRIGRENEEIRARNAEAAAMRAIEENLRELCRLAADKAENIYEYREMLEGWRVTVGERGGDLLIGDGDDPSFEPRPLSGMCPELAGDGLEERFLQNVEADIREKGRRALAERAAARAEAARIEGIKRSYLAAMGSALAEYRREARAAKGTPLGEFPKLKMPKVPKEVREDQEVRQAYLSYRYKADDLRLGLASGVPKKKTGGHGSGGAPAQGQEQRRVVEQSRPAQGRSQQQNR